MGGGCSPGPSNRARRKGVLQSGTWGGQPSVGVGGVLGRPWLGTGSGAPRPKGSTGRPALYWAGGRAQRGDGGGAGLGSRDLGAGRTAGERAGPRELGASPPFGPGGQPVSSPPPPRSGGAADWTTGSALSSWPKVVFGKRLPPGSPLGGREFAPTNRIPYSVSARPPLLQRHPGRASGPSAKTRPALAKARVPTSRRGRLGGGGTWAEVFKATRGVPQSLVGGQRGPRVPPLSDPSPGWREVGGGLARARSWASRWGGRRGKGRAETAPRLARPCPG